MPEYRSPGVYVEEVPSGAVPIQGVSTSTVGFVGCSERGPLRPTLVTSWLDFQRTYGGLPAGGEIAALGYLAHAVQGFFANGGQRAYVARVTDAKTADKVAGLEIGAGGKAKLVVAALGPGNAGGNILVKLKDASLPAQDLFALSVIYYRGPADKPTADPAKLPDPDLAASVLSPDYREPTQRETFDNLSLDPAAPNYVKTVVDEASNLITISKTTAGPLDRIPKPTYRSLTIADPIAPTLPAPADYEGKGTERGLETLGAIAEISLLCIPDQGMDSLYGPLSSALQRHCEAVKRCFVVAQFKRDAGPIERLRPPIDSSYVALYHPWLTIQDPETETLVAVPPGGHVAGVYARTDIERGVHKAPANEIVLGPIMSNVGKQGPLVSTVTAAEQDILNPRGVNCLRDFRDQGRGVRVWGARTASSEGEWRYVAVRRLALFVEQSLQAGTQWVVFEPNDEPLWSRVTGTVSGFLGSLWRDGALMGASPEEAFFVKCDRTTMSQDDIDNGRLIFLVGIAPVKPAEFVIFRIGQKTADSPG